MATLLSVDLGLKTGLALYGEDGRLIWYRSKNFGSPKRLKAAVHPILKEAPELQYVFVEGRGELGDIWLRACNRIGVQLQFISAEEWRGDLLYARHQRTGPDAKHHADQLARKTIEWSGAARPETSLRHDTAEAVLIGLWGVKKVGWLKKIPQLILRNR